jgi:hypothetical protein
MVGIIFITLIYFQDSVSVHNPSFYAHRFLDFMADKVFKKIPSRKSKAIFTLFFSFLSFSDPFNPESLRCTSRVRGVITAAAHDIHCCLRL